MDYQASTPVDPRVFEAMRPYFLENFANPHSNDHILGWQANTAIEKARSQIAELIKSEPDEILFTSGATESNNLVLQGLKTFSKNLGRNKVLISAIEHKCVLETARQIEKQGFIVQEIPVDGEGNIRLDVFNQLLNEDVLLVSIMAVNNEVGTVQPLKQISDRCSQYGTLFHTDAAQALTAIDLDVQALDVDFMSLSAHKAYGPKGIGALYVERSLRPLLHPLIFGGGQEDGIRAGTLPTPNCVGFGEACQILKDEGGEERHRVSALRDKFYKELKTMYKNINLNGPSLENRHPGNLNVCLQGVDAKSLLSSLQPYIAAATGSACTSGIPEPSYVLRAMGLTGVDAESSVRFSLGRYTTAQEIEEALSVIKNVSFCYN